VALYTISENEEMIMASKKTMFGIALLAAMSVMAFSQEADDENVFESEQDQVLSQEVDGGSDSEVVAAEVFSQKANNFDAMPKNTIVVDIGPTIIGVGAGSVSNMVDMEGLSTKGFGIGVQYERQLLERLGVALKFTYLGVGAGIEVDYTNVNLDISSFSIEGIARYYPFGGTFFLGGMLGFAHMQLAASGKIEFDDDYGNSRAESISLNVGRGYFKLGAKLGWRIDFGRPGGFTFEPSIGYNAGIGVGKPLGESLANEISRIGGDQDAGDFEGLDKPFKLLEDLVFVGGPRLSLAFGWRF
jgi:hypothetical protein